MLSSAGSEIAGDVGECDVGEDGRGNEGEEMEEKMKEDVYIHQSSGWKIMSPHSYLT